MSLWICECKPLNPYQSWEGWASFSFLLPRAIASSTVAGNSHPWKKELQINETYKEPTSSLWEEESENADNDRGPAHDDEGEEVGHAVQVRDGGGQEGTQSGQGGAGSCILRHISNTLWHNVKRGIWRLSRPLLRLVWDYSQYSLFWVCRSTPVNAIPLLQECSHKSDAVLLGVLPY